MSERNVVLLDDDVRGSQLRIAILRYSGYAVKLASTSSEAKSILATDPDVSALIVATSEPKPDVILFCEKLRSRSKFPILFIGHSVWPEVSNRKYFDAYVHKLDGPEVWIRRLRELIMRSEARREHDGINILNVDDNDVQRYAITKLLMTGGYKVVEAATGQQTLDLATSKPDLILLDINLPDIDGFEVCRRLRTNPVTADIAIVHLSATHTRPESRSKGLRNGADAYLCQPIGRDALLNTIDSVLSRPLN